MTQEKWRMLLLLLINFVIALIYLIWNLLQEKRDKEKKQREAHAAEKAELNSGDGKSSEGKTSEAEPSKTGLSQPKLRTDEKPAKKYNPNFRMIFVVMLLAPVIGEAFCFLAMIWYRIFFSEPVDLEDVVFSKGRIKAVVRAQEEEERNIVSLEEAIEVTDTKDLRTLMMNVVRGDIKEYLASVSLALNSEDTETAHYAASVLQDALNQFRFLVEKKKRVAFTEDVNQRTNLEELFDLMDPVLTQKVFLEEEQNGFVVLFENVADQLYEKWPDAMTPERYRSVVMRVLDIQEFALGKKWCDRVQAYYPDDLITYYCQLKYYFSTGERETFFEVVDRLKKSAVVVDSEVLELMRTFR